MKHNLKKLYLSYVNEFISVTAFADYYGFSDIQAERIIGIGRKLNNNGR